MTAGYLLNTGKKTGCKGALKRKDLDSPHSQLMLGIKLWQDILLGFLGFVADRVPGCSETGRDPPVSASRLLSILEHPNVCAQAEC